MNSGGRFRAMLALAEMPFIDCPSLAAVCGMAERSAYEAVADLERIGLAANVPHAAHPVRPMRRFYLTGAGLSLLALGTGTLRPTRLLGIVSGLPRLASDPARAARFGRRHLQAGRGDGRRGGTGRAALVPGVPAGRRDRAPRRPDGRGGQAGTHLRPDGVCTGGSGGSARCRA